MGTGSPKGTNNAVELLFGTSLYDLKQKDMPPAAGLTEKDGLRLYTAAAALLRVPDAFFGRYPIEARVTLAAVGGVAGHPPGTVRVGDQQNDRQGASHHGAGAASGPRRRDSRLARGHSQSGQLCLLPHGLFGAKEACWRRGS
jgi:hypothetical protein